MVTRLGPGAEFDLIRRFLDRPRTAVSGVRLGPGDDCAVVEGDGVAVTVDMVVEDVHFRRGWLEPSEIGYHAAAAALSDLAAMASRPLGILVSLALPPGDEGAFAEQLSAGAARAAADVDSAILGGDVTRSAGPLVVDVVALGDAGREVRRSGARPGDEVWVTGELGAAAAAVRDWLVGREPSPEARRAFARPRPRTREALWLRERELPTAMVDLSDGIAGDAAHIAAASGVRIVIEAARLPVSPSAAGADSLRLAAAGGQDYELCFTAAPGSVERHRSSFSERFDTALTRVGVVEEGEEAVIVDERGRELRLEAYQHWRGNG